MNIFIVALIIFCIGILTIAFCTWSIKTILKNTALHNAFGYICAAQSFADGGVAICFTFWVAPVLIFNPDIASNLIGFGIGHFVCYFYYCAIWLHLCKSINRCYAIVFPIHYRIAFTNKNVMILIGSAMTLALLCIGTSFMYPCNYYFDVIDFIWTSRSSECEETISKYTDLAVVFVSAVGSVILDVITFCYLIIFNKNSKLNYGMNAYNEKKFFAQTCLTTFIHTVSLLFSYVVTGYTENVTAIFLLSTVNWELLHLLNQVFFIAFTINIKAAVTKRFSILSNTSRVILELTEMFIITSSCAAIIIFIIGVLTICFSICSLRIIQKNSLLHNAFGCICTVQSLAEIGVATCFAFWAAPNLLFDSSLASSALGFDIGHFTIFFYFLSLWLHLCKSINRCYAIIFPIYYRAYFTIKNAIKLIVFAMFLTLIFISTSFFYPCNYYFNTSNFLWTSRDKSCYDTIAMYTDLIINFCATAGSLICDLITLFYLIAFNKKVKDNHGTNILNEKKFFAQTILSTLLYTVTWINSYIISEITTSITGDFLLITVNWQLFHLSNEFLFIIFTIKMKEGTKRFSIFSINSKVKAVSHDTA